MATPSEILGLFTSPQQYQQQQQDLARSRAMEFARLDPFQQANAAIGQGAYGLAGAIGGALGGVDPQLQKITQRQQLLGMIDPANPDSYGQAIQAALQTGDQEAAFLLRNEMMKVKEQAQNQQMNELKNRDFLEQRGQDIKAAGLTNLANELVGQIKNPDGTINEEVKAKLLSFPQGRAAISEQAKVLPDLRKLGAAGTPEENPFQVFINDQTIPANVRTLANQYSTSLNKGILDPDKIDARVKELTDMTQRIQQFEQNQQQIKSNQDAMAAYRSQGLQNTQAYLAIAQSNNALAQQNAAFKQEEKANKPLRPDLAKDEEEDYKVASSARNLAIEANNYVNSIKSGNIKFGLKDRASIAARNVLGSDDPDVVARNDFERFKTRLVNESLRLNKGTQTEGDAQRSIKELQGAESAIDAAKAINTLAELNARKVQDAQTSIERRRINAGSKLPEVPIETLKFEPQIFTNAEYSSFLKNPKYPKGTVFVDPQGVRRVKP